MLILNCKFPQTRYFQTMIWHTNVWNAFIFQNQSKNLGKNIGGRGDLQGFMLTGVSSEKFKVMYVLAISGAWEMQLDWKWKYWSILDWRGKSFLASWKSTSAWMVITPSTQVSFLPGTFIVTQHGQVVAVTGTKQGRGYGSIFIVPHTRKLERILLA